MVRLVVQEQNGEIYSAMVFLQLSTVKLQWWSSECWHSIMHDRRGERVYERETIWYLLLARMYLALSLVNPRATLDRSISQSQKSGGYKYFHTAPPEKASHTIHLETPQYSHSISCYCGANCRMIVLLQNIALKPIRLCPPRALRVIRA
jgi:hypothetical protein